jgi:spermidine/putrescine transport system ATP-binding protein
MTAPVLAVRGLAKAYGDHRALVGIDLEVGEGEFVALLGPSGCGKTTLLRCIGGFVAADAGTISIAGQDVTRAPPYRRPLNTVFQSYALFPHMSVVDNVAFGPMRAGVPRQAALRAAGEALALTGLAAFAGRFPRELSGGQQQRAALARAIVNKPKLLLLDEPLSALDLKLRRRMQIELKELQARLGIAFVFVTHDQDEALTMADRVAVMRNGGIEQIGPGEALYRTPATRFVADFVGEANLIPCQDEESGALRPAVGSKSFARPAGLDGPVLAVLRPEDVLLLEEGPADPELSTAEAVVERGIRGAGDTVLRLRAGDVALHVRRLGVAGSIPAAGARLRIGYRPERVHLVLADPGEAS